MLKKIKDFLFGGNVLYYPGCLTHFALPDIEQNYRTLLDMMEIDYVLIKEFNCCGSPVRNAGYKDDFEELVEKNRDLLRKYGIKRVITSCPGCFLTLKDEYGLDVEHISAVIARNMDKIDRRFALDIEGNRITYHDPCHLGRQGGIYEEPRSIIGHLGLELHELPSNRNMSLCCGAGAGMRNNNPSLAKTVAKKRLELSGTKTLVTPCPMCYMHFKENSWESGIDIIEFSELLLGKKHKMLTPADEEVKNG